MIETPVQFLELWDTVGALALGRWLSGYHRISPANVAHVCHAVALDEERRHFWPKLWLNQGHSGQLVEEMLFAGAHANVGGGYCDTRLSSIPLSWILSRARESGLVIEDQEIDAMICERALESRRASNIEFWHKCPILGPLVTSLGIDRVRRPVHFGQQLHPSVIEAVGEGRYHPIAHGIEKLMLA